MSKVQIEKDFRHLSMGRNPTEQMQKYYKKKKKEMFLISVAGIVVLLCSMFGEHKNSIIENNHLLRNENGEGKKEVSLELKINDEMWQPFSFWLEEKSYTTEEMDRLFQVAFQELEEVITGENPSLNQVCEDLNLVSSLEDYPFFLSWESSNIKILDDTGKLFFENINEKEQVELKVTFSCDEWEKAEIIKVTILPKEKEDTLFFLQETLKKTEAESRKDKIFQLPTQYEDKALQWRYTKSNAPFILGILFLFLFPFISYQKDEEIHKEAKRREQQLLFSFPEFVSKLILFMEAGMSIKSSIFRISEDYQKKKRLKKESIYLYEELWFICKQMKNGLSEKEGYELLAARCNLPCYRKLSSLLIQHLQKGSVTILDNLRRESLKANEEQKGQIQKKGEEISTKLLFPMIIMLGIVMVFIMVPALFSFQM